jgi:hypothetical protein
MKAVVKVTKLLKNYINGKWIVSHSNQTEPVPNPAT